MWPGATLVVLLALTGGCRGGESRFCSELRRVDKALGALREAKAKDAFGRVPDLVDTVANTYEGIEPPPELRGDWLTAIEFFRRQVDNARSLVTSGRFPDTSDEDDARYDQAFTHIADYGVAHCGRVRGKLVP